MSTTPDAALVYERYMVLTRLAAARLGGTMGGRLLLYGSIDLHGSACTLAANIAGATTLGISPDKEILKQAIRNGVCDFMVNTLDEALRILKNEIRKKQPVSVCLGQRLDLAMREMVARGVQPEVLALSSEESEECAGEVSLLLERGAIRLEDSEAPDLAAEVSPGREGMHWGVEEFPALWLPLVDAVAAEVVGDELRRRWLRLAPRYLGRRAHALRYVEMTAKEIEYFGRALRALLAEGTIKTAVTLKFGGSEERLAPSIPI